MKRAKTTVWKFAFRALVLLAILQVLDSAVFSNVTAADQAHVLFLQVLVGFLLAAVFLGPLVRNLILGDKQEVRPQVPSAATTNTSNVYDSDVKNSRRLFRLYVTEVVSLGLMWVAIAGVLTTVQLNHGSYISLMRHGVLVSAFAVSVVVIAMPTGWRDERRSAPIRLARLMLPTLIIAAVNWWLVPAILLLVLTPAFQLSEYLRVIFPVWYVMLPVAALALRKYRGA